MSVVNTTVESWTPWLWHLRFLLCVFRKFRCLVVLYCLSQVSIGTTTDTCFGEETQRYVWCAVLVMSRTPQTMKWIRKDTFHIQMTVFPLNTGQTFNIVRLFTGCSLGEEKQESWQGNSWLHHMDDTFLRCGWWSSWAVMTKLWRIPEEDFQESTKGRYI